MSCSISTSSNYTLYRTVRVNTTGTNSLFLSTVATLIGEAGREHFHTFASAISRTQSCSISGAQGCGLIRRGADKVRVKFPSKNTLYKEASASNELTFTFSYLKILIKKMRSTPKWAPGIRTHIIPIPSTTCLFAFVQFEAGYSYNIEQERQRVFQLLYSDLVLPMLSGCVYYYQIVCSLFSFLFKCTCTSCDFT